MQPFHLYLSLRHLWESPKMKTARVRSSMEIRSDRRVDAPLSLRDRLASRAHTLEIIVRRREWRSDPDFARDIERRILDEELLDLSLATLADEHETR